MSSTSDSDSSGGRRTDSKKETLDSGGRLGKKGAEKEQQQILSEGAKQDQGKGREKRAAEVTRKEKDDDKRLKREREREDAPKRDRHGERRFREVKEKDTTRPVRDRDIRERDLTKEMRERELSRDVKDRDASRDFKERDHSSYRTGSDRWRSDDRPWPRGADQDQDRGYGRGRGRRFSGPGRRYNGNDGRYRDGGNRHGWGDGDRDSFPRRQHLSYQSRGEKWQHDMFETLPTGPNAQEPEEDPVAKVEALLAS